MSKTCQLDFSILAIIAGPISMAGLLCYLSIQESNNTLESLWQLLSLAEVTPKRLGTLQP